MKRYALLKAIGCSTINAGFIAVINILFSVPEGKIIFMHVEIDY